MLGSAIALAAMAHVEQTRFDGSPYILHPIRVMLKMESYDTQIVAILHDVLEDTVATLDDVYGLLKLDQALYNSILLLIKPTNRSYDEYIKKIAVDPIACEVKRADLVDNLNASTLLACEEKDRKRITKYLKAYSFLKTGKGYDK